MDADRLAPWYRAVEHAAFGRALERCRFAFLGKLAGARRILLIGEGDGRVLRRVLAAAPGAEIDVIESSGAMIGHARARAGNTGRVCFRREDIRVAALGAGEYDAVATFFLLDCFGDEEARAVADIIARAIRPGGVWLHGDFAVPGQGWRRYHAKIWLWTMYRFFAVTTGLATRELPAIRAVIAEAGMRRVGCKTQRWGMLVSEVFEKPLR